MTAATGARAANRRAPPVPVPARLVVCLLGEVVVVVDDRSVPELAGPRMQLLWARLVLARGRPLLRNQLAGELWPESSDSQARTNLRKLLHQLRRALPGTPVVDIDSRAVRWCGGSSVWVDVLTFTEAIARGDPGEAIGSYGGTLLPDRDDDWVEAERERLRRLAVEALARLATGADAEHRDADVVGHTRHLLRIDPLYEPAQRLLMRALVRRGERSEALRTYDRLAGRLDSEFGVAPEPATTALSEQLRHRTGVIMPGRFWSAGRASGGRRLRHGSRPPAVVLACCA